MKSKISFFNKTIFWKNITLYWPIWGIYSLLLFIYQPAIFFLASEMSMDYTGYSKEMRFQDLLSCLYFEPIIVIIAGAAVVTGMALYSYLYNAKSANMIHSLPVDRKQLYVTNLLSGWAFLVVPLFVSATLMSVIALCYGTPGIQFIWMFFLATSAIAVIFFAFVTFCAMFTGHIVVLPLYVVVVNYLSWIVYYLFYIVITTFGFGVQDLGENAEKIAQTCSPWECFYNNMLVAVEHSKDGKIIGASLEGIPYVLVYLVIAVVLYIAAYVVYKTRRIESAGDFLTVNWVKPIFRGAVGILGGIYSAMLIRSILLETRIGCNVFTFVLIMFFIGIICYFVADMFIKKSFHVFKKKNWIGCGIFSVVLLLFFGGMYGVAESYENYIPEKSQIKSASVNLGYEIELEGEQIQIVLDMHKMFLENADEIEGIIESGDYHHDSIRIRYVLEDEPWVVRRYHVPLEVEALVPFYEKIIALESDPEIYLKNEFGKNYDKMEVFYGATAEAPFIANKDSEDRVMEDITYDVLHFEPAQAKELYYAAIEDVKAGTLMKYNVYSNRYQDPSGEVLYVKSTEASISIEYKNPANEETKPVYAVNDSFVSDMGTIEYQASDMLYFSFGPDCENIVNKLIEFGFIESVEDIWWGEAEELLNVESY